MIPLIWAIAGVLLVVAEVLSGELVLAMFGAAALGTAGASALGVPLGPDLAVFAVLSGLLVLLVRPAVNRRLRGHERVNTGTRALLGVRAEVVEAITARTGTVRIRGALWSARTLHDDDLAAGTAVVVVEISGATAVVTAADPRKGVRTVGTVLLVFLVLVLILVITTVAKSVTVVRQAEAAVVERLGRYQRTAEPGLTFLVPFIDRIRERVALWEQVVSFPPQPVITRDNLTVSIDTVVYYQVTEPRNAVYEISDYINGVQQLTTTTLRDVVGGMSLEEALTSRETINTGLRRALDDATGPWGLRVVRVELKAIDPPPSIQDSMEKQMRADREKRAMILTAEGHREASVTEAQGNKQAAILNAEGAKQSAILEAEADRQSRMLRAQGERAARYYQAQGQAKAIEKVFAAIKAGKPTPELLAYQYLQTLPQMAQGDANKMWVVPSDFGKALEGFTRMLGAPGEDGVFRFQPSPVDDEAATKRPGDHDEDVADWFDTRTDPEIAAAVAKAEAIATQGVADAGSNGSPGPIA